MATEYCLEILNSGPVQGKRFQIPVDGGTIGRHSRCSVVLDGLLVEDFHAQLYFDGGQPCILDLASAAGTVVNDKPAQNVKLTAGDRIKIDAHEFLITSNGSPAAPLNASPALSIQLPQQSPLGIKPSFLKRLRQDRTLIKRCVIGVLAIAISLAAVWSYPYWRRYKITGEVRRYEQVSKVFVPTSNIEVRLIRKNVPRAMIADRLPGIKDLLKSEEGLAESQRRFIVITLNSVLKIHESDAETTVKSLERNEQNVEPLIKKLERAAELEPLPKSPNSPARVADQCTMEIRAWMETRAVCARHRRFLDESISEYDFKEYFVDDPFVGRISDDNMTLAESLPVVQRAKSGDDGHFSLTGVPYGQYFLFAEVNSHDGKERLVWFEPIELTGKDIDGVLDNFYSAPVKN